METYSRQIEVSPVLQVKFICVNLFPPIKRSLSMLRRKIHKKFNRIYSQAKKKENRYPFDSNNERLVLFSDHHKGDLSPADDFKKNAILYDATLSYYKKEGYKLLVLGDNEELWENRLDQILENYRALIAKEIEMALESPDKKRIRLWGNHDKEVSLRGFKKYNRRRNEKILDNIDYREGLCLGENIFLVHGHQGRFFEDQAWKLSRWAVKFIWKTIQKLLHIGIEGPSENLEIRDDLEMNYYSWAKEKKIILICGHTHRAIFGSMTHFNQLQIDIYLLEKSLLNAQVPAHNKIKKEIKRKKSKIKNILARRAGKHPPSFEEKKGWPVPCYFNAGCCIYTNGITCLEIDKGIIRLIKWERQKKERVILAEKNLEIIIQSVKESRPIQEFPFP